jgi:hypothetical protein
MSSVAQIYKEKGFQEAPIKKVMGDWEFFFYPKQDVVSPQFLEKANTVLFVTGTHIRRKRKQEESIELSLGELNRSILNTQDCLGTYALIHFCDKQITINLAPGNLQNIFYSENKRIFSSSFLAICSAISKCTINKDAATEVLCTGSLIGPDTLVNEVSRFEPNMVHEDEGLQISHLPETRIQGVFKGEYAEAVESQLKTLNEYFQDTAPFADEQGVDSGITSGHDSRLLLALMKRNWHRFQIHTHYRTNKSLEVEIADEVASKVNLPLLKQTVNDAFLLEGDDILMSFEKSFLFCDGLIRMHGFWMEEYNSADYRKKLLNDKTLGISGIGGEQYRNGENLLFKNYNFRRFLEYQLVKNIAGSCFKNKQDESQFLDYFETKVRAQLGIDRKKKVNKLTIKRYFNEILPSSRLGGRNNSENQISFFISPFLEDSITKSAYKILPYLGVNNGFQQSMLRKVDPDLAKVRSDYGYDFYVGESSKNKFKAIIRGLLPAKLYQNLIDRRFQQLSTRTETYLNKQYPKEFLKNVRDLDLPINLNTLLKRPDLMPLVLDLGYFIKRITK